MASSVAFNNYSKEYDNLLLYSTPYVDLLDDLVGIIKNYSLSKTNIKVLDVGAGTGNISKLIVETLTPNNINSLNLMEPSVEMLRIAKTKFQGSNVNYINANFEEHKPENKYDLIVCIHALYLMNQPELLVSKFKGYMHKDTIMIICDLGAEIKMRKWMPYLLYTNTKQYGLIKTLKILSANKEVKKSNKEIASKQRKGIIWKHSLDEFEKIFSKDYDIVEKKKTFLDCSNLLVCKLKDGS